jgi:hypothetical protein
MNPSVAKATATEVKSSSSSSSSSSSNTSSSPKKYRFSFVEMASWTQGRSCYCSFLFCSECILFFSLGMIDMFAPKASKAPVDKTSSNANPAIQNRKASRERTYAEYSKSRYENNRIEAPDGTFLCSCDNKKLNWYLSKNLATVVQ